MRKTLTDLARYLTCTLVPETQDSYGIKPVYELAASPEMIREGVLAFRPFLCRLFDELEDAGDIYDTSKKVAHEYENRTGLSVYFPFLHNVNTMLIRMGYYGTLEKDAEVLVCGSDMFDKKLSVPKTLECLRFLVNCGISMNGIDLTDKKQNLSDIEVIRVTYPDARAMLTGLKALAVAEVDHRSLDNQDVLLRCDYRALKKDETDISSIVGDTIKPLPAEVQDFVLSLHQRYIDKGMTCTAEIKGFHTYIKYRYKRKDVWGLNASLNNGYHINAKPVKMDAYADTIKTFDPYLQKIIAQGYGCGRKRAEIGHCDGGCRGLPIPLDDSVLDMQTDIVSWFDRELSCLQQK